ncbi:hypothetical protein [Novosphingobium sp. 9U]|uniref:hypothetical protein n=1 Tax=Novosphingobium sp. 9U TaxID=2653158 RepID=UPI0012F0B263|nr:hypothetical protein [Novosphingobium sp. 9U]VWX54949.1 hypothetical protein NOVOSPHI9U_710009 [Novosphingobium sp. 9U]
MIEDQGPWFVRVSKNKVAVGVFTCAEDVLAASIDEVTEADACEYKKLPPGGVIFGGAPVLHELDKLKRDYAYIDGWSVTETWGGLFQDDGLWRRIGLPSFANDE